MARRLLAGFASGREGGSGSRAGVARAAPRWRLGRAGGRRVPWRGNRRLDTGDAGAGGDGPGGGGSGRGRDASRGGGRPAGLVAEGDLRAGQPVQVERGGDPREQGVEALDERVRLGAAALAAGGERPAAGRVLQVAQRAGVVQAASDDAGQLAGQPVGAGPLGEGHQVGRDGQRPPPGEQAGVAAGQRGQLADPAGRHAERASQVAEASAGAVLRKQLVDRHRLQARPVVGQLA